jgi:ribonuclease HI
LPQNFPNYRTVTLEEPHRVELQSDSRWLVNCATWYWGRHVHHELWQALDDLAQVHSIHWHWVRGHVGDPCNERAHQLAEAGRLNDPADPSSHRSDKQNGMEC